MHLVHPEHGALMVFNISGVAVCPACRAMWYRDRKGVMLLNERKPPKRAAPVLVNERRPPKQATRGKAGR
jgi:hypothetical protein